MAQNRSAAVMQQRSEAHDSLDHFPTPPWATRALCEQLIARGYGPLMHCVEPACAEGRMARPLAEYFLRVEASDVHDYGAGYPVDDFLFPGAPRRPCDWIVTNPPFRLAEQFIETALDRAAIGVAMLVRTSFLEGQNRCEALFKRHRPNLVLQFAERVLMLKGRIVKAGDVDPETCKRVTSATSYCWLVWGHPPRRDDHGNLTPRTPAAITELDWIAPCRLRLEREGDYPVYPRSDAA